MKLYTHNFNGNLHEICQMINRHLPNLVESVVHLESVSGSLSIAVFRVTDAQYEVLTNNDLHPSERFEAVRRSGKPTHVPIHRPRTGPWDY